MEGEICSDMVGYGSRYGRIRYGMVEEIWSDMVEYGRGIWSDKVGYGRGNMIGYSRVW